LGPSPQGKNFDVADGSLETYRKKRNREKTPEPIPAKGSGNATAGSAAQPLFVIQEHHASSLHWDFRLEHDGVLASWALPKGLPLSPHENHLAVHVEDHPLEYRHFSGTIPEGEYGGGKVSIWAKGWYECEKWSDKEIKVVLHGRKAHGRFVLFPTKGKNWMIHRMDEPMDDFQPLPQKMDPMLAVAGSLPSTDDGWAYEFKWDGVRALAWVDGGRARAESRAGNDLTRSFPELREMAEAIGSDQVLLDGEIVVLEESGGQSFSRLQHRMHLTGPKDVARAVADNPATFVIFDLLHVNGRSLLSMSYDDRRSELEGLGVGGPRWAVTPSFVDQHGPDVLNSAVGLGMEGVVAKRRSSPYRPGSRNGDWIKVKDQRTQEVIIGGWTAGQGSRRNSFGALLLGLPTHGGRQLTYVGKVGTGFSNRAADELTTQMGALRRGTSPFAVKLTAAESAGVTWIRPSIVGEVRFSEWTPDGRFRHPVWRGLRPDKKLKDVRRES
jgi:bifunctional non-homologous end joining protein LigD